MTLVDLRAGITRVRLAPEIGGAIVDWQYGNVPILRPTADGELVHGEANRLGSYPLVPYSNRIDSGRFAFDGTAHRLALNFGDRPHSIHGIGWQRHWSVHEAAANSVALRLDHDPARDGASGWPFHIFAEQRFELSPDRLRIAMRVENRDTRPMPAGIGQHPYFPRTPGVELQFEARGVWHNGDDYLPSTHTALPQRWDYATSRALGWPDVDNCFDGWNGHARIVWPEHRLALTISADPVHSHCVVFTPAGQNFFAFEPVSHMNDGVNRMNEVANHGIHRLASGEALEGTVTMQVEPI